MTDEERQRTMDFILQKQAQFVVNIESLRQRVDTIATGVDGLREAQAHTDATIAQMARQQAHINEVVAVIAESQQHTDERLNALIDIVSKGRNGKAR